MSATATATSPTAPPTALLIRRLGGVEWPAAGDWPLPPGGSLEVRRTQRLRSRTARVPISGGTLVVDERGLHSTLDLRLASAPSATDGLAVHAEVTAAHADGSW